MISHKVKSILIDRQFDAELFADNLRLLREGKGLTQAELGSLCGISENAIRNYELGRCFPKITTLNALADLRIPMLAVEDVPAIACQGILAVQVTAHVLAMTLAGNGLARIPEGGSLAEQNCGEKPPRDPAQTVSEVQ